MDFLSILNPAPAGPSPIEGSGDHTAAEVAVPGRFAGQNTENGSNGNGSTCGGGGSNEGGGDSCSDCMGIESSDEYDGDEAQFVNMGKPSPHCLNRRLNGKGSSSRNGGHDARGGSDHSNGASEAVEMDGSPKREPARAPTGAEAMWRQSTGSAPAATANYFRGAGLLGRRSPAQQQGRIHTGSVAAIRGGRGPGAGRGHRVQRSFPSGIRGHARPAVRSWDAVASSSGPGGGEAGVNDRRGSDGHWGSGASA
ncbi:unnamed protein product, partial [Phaeothamnion confervicola]